MYFQPAAGVGVSDQVRKSYTVRQRRVSDLEHKYERQQHVTRAAKEGATALSMGDYEYLPFMAGGPGRKGPAQRAYASRTNPRFFDRVAYAQTNNPHAQLQVRRRSTAQQNMERGSNALKVGGSGAAAGMALGLRGLSARQMGQLGMRLGSGDFTALLTPRGKKAAAIIGGAGALIGAGMRPAPVSLQYQRPEGNAAWRRSKRRERNR